MARNEQMVLRQHKSALGQWPHSHVAARTPAQDSGSRTCLMLQAATGYGMRAHTMLDCRHRHPITFRLQLVQAAYTIHDTARRSLHPCATPVSSQTFAIACLAQSLVPIGLRVFPFPRPRRPHRPRVASQARPAPRRVCAVTRSTWRYPCP